MTDDTQIRNLHNAYVKLTGLDLDYSLGRYFCWQSWLSCGWTEADLALVVKHTKAHRNYQPYWLGFRTIISDTDRFGELLAEARCDERAAKSRYCPDKQSVLRATGRQDRPEQGQAQSAEQVMRGNAALAELLKVRDQL